jgi:hypothetical protein
MMPMITPRLPKADANSLASTIAGSPMKLAAMAMTVGLQSEPKEAVAWPACASTRKLTAQDLMADDSLL